ncbi:hypothetical protein ABQE93_24330 [Mycolicibacterium sp. XJ662]
MAAIDPAVARHRAAVAGRTRAVRNGECPPQTLADAKRDLAEAKIAAYIEKALVAAPPLSDEQLSRLAELLKPAPHGDGV